MRNFRGIIVVLSLAALVCVVAIDTTAEIQIFIHDHKNVDRGDSTRTATNMESHRCTRLEERERHPHLCAFLDMDVNEFSKFAHEWSKDRGLLVDLRTDQNKEQGTLPVTPVKNVHSQNNQQQQEQPTKQLPVVFAHGMGDSCFNSGMKRVTSQVSKWLSNVYTTCIPVGANQADDTRNGYFLNLFDSIELFTNAIRNNTALRDGFHGIGFSQGTAILRGYMALYNDPPIHSYISVNGVNAGVGAVPHCVPSTIKTTENARRLESRDTTINYNKNTNTDKKMDFVKDNQSDVLSASSSSFCRYLLEQTSKRAYTRFAQEHSFQANYWRDPRRAEQTTNYCRYSQLAILNNEGCDSLDGEHNTKKKKNQTLIDNYLKTQKFIWIRALDDTMIWPNEGEHWGEVDPDDPFKGSSSVLAMNQTEWYQMDLFGLQEAQLEGKNYFESFRGDHLEFSMEDLEKWVRTYLVT